MRNFYLFLLAVSSFIAIEACKPDPVVPPPPPPPPPQPTTSMVINGDGFTNHKVVFDLAGESYMEYLTDVDRTEFEMAGDSNNTEFIMVGSFDGKSTGTFNLPGATVMDFTHIDTAANVSKNYAATTGSIVITSYNAVGGNVIGTFSGTFKNPTTGAEIQVTQGKFELARRPDR